MKKGDECIDTQAGREGGGREGGGREGKEGERRERGGREEGWRRGEREGVVWRREGGREGGRGELLTVKYSCAFEDSRMSYITSGTLK